MRLLLTSSGITNKSIEKALLELLGKPFKEAHLVFIPTAANIEKGDKTWLVNDMNNFRKLGFASLDIIDISAVSKEIWLPSIDKADILVFGGGNVYHLLKWIKKSGLESILPELLKTKVYVGISAGSRALTRSLIMSSSSTAKDVGLEIVNFSIVPHINSQHFSERTFEKVLEESKKVSYPVYAIDDNTSIKVVDKQITVVSEGKWKKFN
jgi:dipeptidase E